GRRAKARVGRAERREPDFLAARARERRIGRARRSIRERILRRRLARPPRCDPGPPRGRAGPRIASPPRALALRAMRTPARRRARLAPEGQPRTGAAGKARAQTPPPVPASRPPEPPA